jgi:hypothetical protein
MTKFSIKTLGLGLACALGSLIMTQIAMAQFIWINEQGVKQYSDKPPPANTPKNKIIKGLQAPALASKNSSANAANSNEANAAQDPNKVTETPRQLMQKKMAAQEEEFSAYKKARDDNEKKELEEKEQKAQKEKNCARALSQKLTLEMAEPISIFNKKGEREFITDEARKKELEETQKILSDCKS